jgi:hypothetical protein
MEAIFLRDAAAIEGVANALPHEPEFVPELKEGAAVTMFMRLPKQTDVETGTGCEVEYGWLVHIYVPLYDYALAAEQVKEVVCGLLRITRVNPRLDETCDWAELSSGGDEPAYNHKEGWVLCQLSLRATKTEY